MRSWHSFPPLRAGLNIYLTLYLVPEASGALHLDHSDTIQEGWSLLRGVDNLLVCYYLGTSEICPDEKGGLWWEGPYKKGTATPVLLFFHYTCNIFIKIVLLRTKFVKMSQGWDFILVTSLVTKTYVPSRETTPLIKTLFHCWMGCPHKRGTTVIRNNSFSRIFSINYWKIL
jgi:hypothetical protein